MRTQIISALLVALSANVAAAAAPVDVPSAAGHAVLSQTKTDDDEEDPAPASAKPATKAAAAPVTEGSVTAPPPPENANEQKLVNGAPLYNPNVAVHIVEQKAFSDARKFEVTLFPASIQVNGKFTQHYGTNVSLTYHLQENFAFLLTGYYNWSTQESAFNAELIDKASEQAQAATSLLNTWGAIAGVEVTPFYGKFVWFENSLVHFSIVLNGGAGAGGTRHTLKPVTREVNPQDPTDEVFVPATYGDTGTRFIGMLGGGFRVQFGERFAVRMEVRDIVYTAKVDRVNGCDNSDLRAMNDANNMGRTPGSVNVSSGCGVDQFITKDPAGKDKFSADVPLAYGLVRTPSSDVLNNLGFYLGVSFLF